MTRKKFFPLVILVIFQIISFIASQALKDPYRHSVTLDRYGNYRLQWQVEWSERRVYFNVTVATRGFIQFGLARDRNGLAGADIVVGGVLPGGESYFSDRYVIGNETERSVEDPSQDWVLHSARETRTHTFLSFSRLFDTCDADNDLPITDDLSTIVWAYSEMDNMNGNGRVRDRGEFDVYMLDPDLTPDLEEFKRRERTGVRQSMRRFPMTATLPLPQVDTMYWCHFFKVPTNTKHHIIGFNTDFPSERDRKHVHHLLVHRCRAPPGANPDRFFGPATRTQGTECFFVGEPHRLPTEYCQEVTHLWGVGGRPIFFPENAGMAMSENGSEYFMIQVHYDNQDIERYDVTFTVEAYYTENLRQHDVGMIPLGEMTPAATSIVIPPNSVGHVIHGYCPPECLEKMLPQQGVTVFAGFLHTHLLGNGVRFLHFREDRELPWISNADFYNFNYQQFRLLINERRILPGDQLGMRCSYNTTPRNGSTVVGGHSTRDEMCTGHLYYYSSEPIRFSFCRSEVRTREYMELLGIRNTTWDPSRRQMMITDPPEYAGLTVYDYANEEIEWTTEMREAVQDAQLYEPQSTQCPIVDDTPPDIQEWMEAEESSENPSLRGVRRYRKPEQCTRDSTLPWGRGNSDQAKSRSLSQSQQRTINLLAEAEDQRHLKNWRTWRGSL